MIFVDKHHGAGSEAGVGGNAGGEGSSALASGAIILHRPLSLLVFPEIRLAALTRVFRSRRYQRIIFRLSSILHEQPA